LSIEREQALPSIIDKLFQRVGRTEPLPLPSSAEQAAAPPLATCRNIEPQGLFVIGAARTGTTILQNALNDSDDIFLFGEPSFHKDSDSGDFATRYNGMHRAWGNQENKSSYCPRLFESDANWPTYLARLADLYRYVGSKVVINPAHAEEEARLIFDFHCRHFYASHYIFTFRNPLDVLMSTRGLAQLNGGTVATFAQVLKGYFVVIQLFIRMLRNLQHVHVVFHEAVDAEVFRTLEKSLGIPLAHANEYYDRGKVRHYELTAVPEAYRALTAEAIAHYEDFKRDALAGFDLVQIEQNDGHLDPGHFTSLGRLSWRITRFLDTIDHH
jgi:hypothetical protein